MLLLLLFLMVVVLLLFPLLLLEKMMGSNNPFYQSPDEYPPGGTRVRVPAGFPVGDEPFDFSPMLELELPVPFCIADPPFCVSDVYPVPVTGLPSLHLRVRLNGVTSTPSPVTGLRGMQDAPPARIFDRITGTEHAKFSDRASERYHPLPHVKQ